MAARIPTFALLVALVACGSGRIPIGADPVYLEGATSRSPVSPTQLRSSLALPNHPPHTVVAGDDDLVLTGSMLRSATLLTLDLTVVNRADRTIVLRRSNIHLRDHLGRRLPVEDADQDLLSLDPGQEQPYVARWRAQDLTYPLFVMLYVDEKNLTLRFDAPRVP